MDQLISKLTNFGYELLGIFVPGAILLLFILIGWWCLGPLAEVWSLGLLPQAHIKEVSGLLNLLNEEIRAGMFIALAVAAYFLGHLLHWSSRSGKGVEVSSMSRVLLCLRFSIPKPQASYDLKLEPLFKEAKSFLGFSPDADWRQFYPVAKSYLAANLQTSLVSTYQNKYTLHRSLTAAATIWFWMTIFAVLAALVAVECAGLEPPLWLPLLLSIPVSLGLVWGFSDSYRYNWKLFGDAIITETFMLYRSPTKKKDSDP